MIPDFFYSGEDPIFKCPPDPDPAPDRGLQLSEVTKMTNYKKVFKKGLQKDIKTFSTD
jgi:hypothetical protein